MPQTAIEWVAFSIGALTWPPIIWLGWRFIKQIPPSKSDEGIEHMEQALSKPMQHELRYKRD
jgi:hypothetical protein